MSELKPGDIVNFSLPKGAGRDHIAKVEVMSQTWNTVVDIRDPCLPQKRSLRMLYECRRVDNGTVVLAWEEDLKP